MDMWGALAMELYFEGGLAIFKKGRPVLKGNMKASMFFIFILTL